MKPTPPHIPVLIDELLRILKGGEGYWVRALLDATLGAGGHSESILRAHPEIESYLGVDRDPAALQSARKRLESAFVLPKNSRFCHDSFSAAPALIAAAKTPCDAIVMDLGVSTMQLQCEERGFSFWKDAPLDMRMNPADDLTAARLVNKTPFKKLENLLRSLEVKRAGRIARAICEERVKNPIETTAHLIRITRPYLGKSGKIHPATLLFQALRIAVNDELGQLQDSLKHLAMSLAAMGRIAVISFHSLEDRIVKTTFRELCSTGNFSSMTKKPLIASKEEQRLNRKARSAKLRAIFRNKPPE